MNIQTLNVYVERVLAQVEDLELGDRWTVLEVALEQSTKKSPEEVLMYNDEHLAHEHDWVIDVKTGGANGARLHWLGCNDLTLLLDTFSAGLLKSPGLFGILRCRELEERFDVASIQQAEELKQRFCGEVLELEDEVMGTVTYRAMGLGVWWATPHMGGCEGTRNGLGGCKNPQCGYRGEEKPDV